MHSIRDTPSSSKAFRKGDWWPCARHLRWRTRPAQNPDGLLPTGLRPGLSTTERREETVSAPGVEPGQPRIKRPPSRSSRAREGGGELFEKRPSSYTKTCSSIELPSSRPLEWPGSWPPIGSAGCSSGDDCLKAAPRSHALPHAGIGQVLLSVAVGRRRRRPGQARGTRPTNVEFCAAQIP